MILQAFGSFSLFIPNLDMPPRVKWTKRIRAIFRMYWSRFKKQLWESLRPVLVQAKNLFYIYRTALITPISMFLAVYLLITDGDPPTFPLKDRSLSPIDCYNFKSANIYFEKSRIKIELRVGEFIEYPKEIAASLTNIVTNVGGITMDYYGEKFWDLKSDRENFSYCILQTVSGNVNASLYCHRHLLATAVNRIDDVSIFPVGWSRYFETMQGVGKLNDVCYHKGSLYFFAQPETHFSSIQAAKNYKIPVILDNRKKDTFRVEKNFGSSQTPAYVISSLAKDPYDIFTDVVLPFYAIYVLPENIIFIMQRNQTHLLPYFKSHSDARILSYNSPTCFSELSFVNNAGSVSPTMTNRTIDDTTLLANHYQVLLNVNGIPTLRGNYERLPMESKTIFMDIEASKLTKELILRKYSNITVCVFDEQKSLNETSKDISKSSIMIVSHIKNIFLGYLLTPKSNMIEILPDNLSCAKYGEVVAKKIDAYYTNIGGEGDCNCQDIRCYLETNPSYSQFNKTKFMELLDEMMQ